METRAGEIGICPGAGPFYEAIVRRASERECRTGNPPPDAGLVRYNLLEQKEANGEIARLTHAGRRVVAVGVLAGGALAGGASHGYGARVRLLQGLVRPDRTLAQAAVQFVLANESVSAAWVRVSTIDHLEEILSAPEAPSLTGRDLELIFELWANRFEA